jgi:hypothetical protein
MPLTGSASDPVNPESEDNNTNYVSSSTIKKSEEKEASSQKQNVTYGIKSIRELKKSTRTANAPNYKVTHI